MSTEEFAETQGWADYEKLLIPNSLPTEEETEAFSQELLNPTKDQTLNGNNPLHITSMILAVEIPDHSDNSDVHPTLPIEKLARLVWSKLLEPQHVTIREIVAKGNTPIGRKQVADIIRPTVKLILTPWVPPQLLGIYVTLLVPPVVKWIFLNIDKLPK